MACIAEAIDCGDVWVHCLGCPPHGGGGPRGQRGGLSGGAVGARIRGRDNAGIAALPETPLSLRSGPLTNDQKRQIDNIRESQVVKNRGMAEC